MACGLKKKRSNIYFPATLISLDNQKRDKKKSFDLKRIEWASFYWSHREEETCAGGLNLQEGEKGGEIRKKTGQGGGYCMYLFSGGGEKEIEGHYF